MFRKVEKGSSTQFWSQPELHSKLEDSLGYRVIYYLKMKQNKKMYIHVHDLENISQTQRLIFTRPWIQTQKTIHIPGATTLLSIHFHTLPVTLLITSDVDYFYLVLNRFIHMWPRSIDSFITDFQPYLNIILQFLHIACREPRVVSASCSAISCPKHRYATIHFYILMRSL